MTLDVPTGIRLGDTRSLSAGLPAESVNLIVTSAPYPGRIGGVHPDEFVAWWMPFADQFWRVLHSSGSLVLNIREPCIDGERHTCVLSLIVAMRYRGWLWVDEYCWLPSPTLAGQGPSRLFDRLEGDGSDGWRLHFFCLDQSAIAVLHDAGFGECGPGDPVTFDPEKFVTRRLRQLEGAGRLDKPNDWGWFFD